MPLDLRLETKDGDAFLDSHAIVWVSGVFQKAGYAESRSVGLLSGHTIYMLNTAENIAGLRASGAGDKIPAAPQKPVKREAKQRGRPPKAKAQLAPDSLPAKTDK